MRARSEHAASRTPHPRAIARQGRQAGVELRARSADGRGGRPAGLGLGQRARAERRRGLGRRAGPAVVARRDGALDHADRQPAQSVFLWAAGARPCVVSAVYRAAEDRSIGEWTRGAIDQLYPMLPGVRPEYGLGVDADPGTDAIEHRLQPVCLGHLSNAHSRARGAISAADRGATVSAPRRRLRPARCWPRRRRS